MIPPNTPTSLDMAGIAAFIVAGVFWLFSGIDKYVVPPIQAFAEKLEREQEGRK